MKRLQVVAIAGLAIVGCQKAPPPAAPALSIYVQDLQIIGQAKDDAANRKADADLRAAGAKAVPDLIAQMNDEGNVGLTSMNAAHYLGWTGTHEAAAALLEKADKSSRDDKVTAFTGLETFSRRKSSQPDSDAVRARAEKALADNELRSIELNCGAILAHYHDPRSVPSLQAALKRANVSEDSRKFFSIALQAIKSNKYLDPNGFPPEN